MYRFTQALAGAKEGDGTAIGSVHRLELAERPCHGLPWVKRAIGARWRARWRGGRLSAGDGCFRRKHPPRRGEDVELAYRSRCCGREWQEW